MPFISIEGDEERRQREPNVYSIEGGRAIKIERDQCRFISN
jgi:hypothetical protein